MKRLTRREVCGSLAALGVSGGGVGLRAQVHATESPVPAAPVASRGVAGRDVPQAAGPPTAPTGSGPLASSRTFAFDQMAVRTTANGGESRDIVHGTLATGETVNLHQSSQPAPQPGGSVPALHAIQHSEFILVRDGTVEFAREGAAAERVGPGGVIYVANGTRHAIRNVGDGPARYFVVAIGGDAK